MKPRCPGRGEVQYLLDVLRGGEGVHVFSVSSTRGKKHFKRHDDSLVIKNQLFIEKSKKKVFFSIFRYIEKSNIKISIFKKYRYLSIYRYIATS